MAKYLSGRVKRTPQDRLTDDRYTYLGLEQAEPNLGDPSFDQELVPAGAQYQLIGVVGDPGGRYWIPLQGGQIPGSISVFDEGVLTGVASSITQLNFVGAAVTVTQYSTGPYNGDVLSKTGDIGITTNIITGINTSGITTSYFIQGSFIPQVGVLGAQITSIGNNQVGIGTSTTNTSAQTNQSFTVYPPANPQAAIEVFAPGNNKEIFFNGPPNANTGISTYNQFVTASNFTFDSSIDRLFSGEHLTVGSGVLPTITTKQSNSYVGIFTADPTQHLHIDGNFRLDGFLYDVENKSGVINSFLVAGSTGPKWVQNTQVSAGAGGTIYDVQYHGTTSLIEGASQFVYRSDQNRVGIGTTLPAKLLDVRGESIFRGSVDVDNLLVGIATIGTLGVTGITTSHRVGIGTTALSESSSLQVGYGSTAVTITTDGDLGIGMTDPGSKLDLDGTFNVTGISTFGSDLDINANVNISGISTFGSDLDVNANVNISGITTFGSSLDISGDVDIDGDTELDDVNISGIATVNNLSVTGIGTFDNIQLSDNTVTTTTGNLTLDSFAGTLQVNDQIFVNDATNSTTINDGSIHTDGGVGIEKNLNVGGNANIVGIVTLASNGGIVTTGGDLYIGSDLILSDEGNIVAALGEYADLIVNSQIGIGTDSILGGIQLQVGDSYDPENLIVVTGADNSGDLLVGIGTDVPQSKLDLRGTLNVTGISTFSSFADFNGGAAITTLKVEDLTNNAVVIAGSGGELETDVNFTWDGTQFNVDGVVNVTGIITSQGINLVTGNVLSINNTEILSSTQLSSNVAVELVSLDFNGAIDISQDIEDIDELVIDNGANNVIRKTAVSRLPKYLFGKVSGDFTIAEDGVGTIQPNAVGMGTDTFGQFAKTVIAGVGLTGTTPNADDGTNYTISIGIGTGISGNADDIEIKNYENLTNNTVLKWDDGNGQLTDAIITDTGTNVGISSTQPTAKLDVDGTVHVTGITTFNGGEVNILSGVGHTILPTVDVTHDFGSPTKRWKQLYVETLTGTLDGAADKVKIENDESEDSDRFIIFSEISTNGVSTCRVDEGLRYNPNANKLGIGGASSPTANLDVTGSTELDTLNVSGLSTFASNVDINASVDISTDLEVGVDLNVGGITTIGGNTFIAGNVGINTLIPKQRVHIGSRSIDVNVTKTNVTVNATTTTITLNTSGINEGDIVGPIPGVIAEDTYVQTVNPTTVELTKSSINSPAVTGQTLVFGPVNNENVVVISDTGKIGVATDTPTRNFEVYGTSYVTGIATFVSDVDIDGDLDVDGLAELDTLNVSAGSTFQAVDINGGLTANTAIIEDLTDNRVVIAGTDGELEDDGNLTFDGSTLSIGVGLDVDGLSELDELNVTGIATFTNDVNIGDATGDTLVINASVGSSIIPDDTDTHDLGAVGKIWRKIYADEIEASNITGTLVGASLSIKAFEEKNDSQPHYLTFVSVGTTGISSVFVDDGISYKPETGAVGIGTTNPTTTNVLLDVRGDIYVGGDGSISTITGPSTIVIDPAAVGDNTGKVIIAGDLQVDGTQTIINSTALTVDDKNITLADGAENATQANGAGITIAGANASLTYYSGTERWEFNKPLKTKNIRIGFSGDGEIDTSSGNLVLDSTGGTVEVDDDLTVKTGHTFSIAGHTQNRMLVVGTNGNINDTSGVTYSSSKLTVTNAIDVTSLEVTNIKAKDGTASITVANSTGAVSISEQLNANGDVNLGNADSDTVSIVGKVDSNIIPTLDAQNDPEIDLGDATNRFATIYAQDLNISGGNLSAVNYEIGNLNVTGITTLGDNTNDELYVNAKLDSNLIPKLNASNNPDIDLGDATNKFNNVYAVTFNGDLSGNATTADDLNINATNRILFQDGNQNTVALNHAASTTYLLQSGSSGADPSWIDPGTLSVAFADDAASAGIATTATNLAGGTTGDIPYQTDAGTTTFLADPGSAGDGYVITWDNSNSAPAWTSPSNIAAVDLADKVKTHNSDDDVLYHVTFVDTNHSTAAASTVRTDGELVYNPSDNHLGIGTTNPKTSVQINDSFGLDTGTTNLTIAAINQIGLIDTWDRTVTPFKTAEYTYHITHDNGEFQSGKCLMMMDGVNIYTQEWAIMFTGDSRLANLVGSVGGNNMSLAFEAKVAGDYDIKFTRSTIL